MLAPALALLGLSLLDPDAGAPAAEPVFEPVLLHLEEMGDGNRGYEVTASACRQEQRRIEVRLNLRGKTVPAAGLVLAPWAVPCELDKKSARKDGAVTWDARTPKTAAAPVTATIKIRAVRFEPGMAALWLSQEGGIEHNGRAEQLVALVGKRLRAVWQDEQGLSPGLLTTELVPGTEGPPLLRTVRTVDWAQDVAAAPDPDFFDVELVTWNRKAHKVERRPGPAWAVVLSTAPDVPTARSQLNDLAGRCKDAHPLVVETKDFPTLAKRTKARVAVVAFTLAAPEALKTQKAVKRCAGGNADVVVLRPERP